VPSREAIAQTIPPNARRLLSQQATGNAGNADWQCTIHRADGRLFVDLGPRGLTIVDHLAGRVEGFIVVQATDGTDVLESVLRFGVVEILRSRGLYSVHAAAADRDGRGILIVGASGRGKTTSLLAMLRAGYRVLSDDHPLLRETDDGIEILSFPTKIDVTEKTIALIPEVGAARSRLHDGTNKRWFRVGEIFPDREAERTRPRLLLFPEVIDWPRTSIEPMGKTRALEEVLRQGLLVLDRDVTERQMAAFYRVRLGDDFLGLPSQVDRLLDAGG
jgi:hypothetical protein